MGYILPLPYFKERNYHNRKPIKDDPFYLRNKYPMNHVKRDNKEAKYEYPFYQGQQLHTSKQTHAVNNEKILAEITGKGRNFNEIV